MYIQFDHYLHPAMYSSVSYSRLISSVVRLLPRLPLSLDFRWMYARLIAIASWGAVFSVWMCCSQVSEPKQPELCELVRETPRLASTASVGEHSGDSRSSFSSGSWTENPNELPDAFRSIHVAAWWAGSGDTFGWLFSVRTTKLSLGPLDGVAENIFLLISSMLRGSPLKSPGSDVSVWGTDSWTVHAFSFSCGSVIPGDTSLSLSFRKVQEVLRFNIFFNIYNTEKKVRNSKYRSNVRLSNMYFNLQKSM